MKPGLDPRTLRAAIALSFLTVALGVFAWLAVDAIARPGSVQPIPIPASHAKARAVCPLDKPLACRAALIHAYDAVAWQRQQNLALAREMLGNVADWKCIHPKEGAWTDAGDPYWGGLQMDRGFMLTYGSDMIARHHGGLADTWTPREQIIVAERARASGRGYHPWPQTARACGLL